MGTRIWCEAMGLRRQRHLACGVCRECAAAINCGAGLVSPPFSFFAELLQRQLASKTWNWTTAPAVWRAAPDCPLGSVLCWPGTHEAGIQLCRASPQLLHWQHCVPLCNFSGLFLLLKGPLLWAAPRCQAAHLQLDLLARQHQRQLAHIGLYITRLARRSPYLSASVRTSRVAR